MQKPVFQLPSKFPLSVGAAWLVTSSFSLVLSPACIGENIQLQTQTAQSDKLPTPPVDTDAAASAQTRPAKDAAADGEPAAPPSQDEQTRPVHKLHVSRQDLLDENKDAQSSIDTQFLRTGTARPLVQMPALIRQQQDRHQLFAERDTGYGVCGLVMNVPVLRRAYVSVRKVFPGMPAGQANLQTGDLIVSVNGISTLDIPSAQVWDYLTGTPGTDVQLEMMRGNHPFSVTLKRMDIGHIPDEQVRAEFLTIFELRGGNLHPLQD